MIRNIRPPPKARPPVGYQDNEYGEPAPAQQRGNPDSAQVNLGDWKREGYPNEFAYAQAMGVRNEKPQQPQSLASPTQYRNRDDEIRDAQEKHLSSPTRFGGGGDARRIREEMEIQRQEGLLRQADDQRMQRQAERDDAAAANNAAYEQPEQEAVPLNSPGKADEYNKNKISPRGLAIQENPPFEDPLFQQMVAEEMQRLEMEILQDLDLNQESVSPEGKVLAAQMAAEEGPANFNELQGVLDFDHPYAPRPEDLRNRGGDAGGNDDDRNQAVMAAADAMTDSQLLVQMEERGRGESRGNAQTEYFDDRQQQQQQERQGCRAL